MSEHRNGAPRRAHNTDNSSKPGSRSPKHRGYRPDENKPAKKPRWNADERAARGRSTDRPRGERGARPDWQPREDRGYARGGDRFDRAERSDRGERFDRNDRPQRGDRTDRFGGRGPARDERGERFGDRPQRGFDRGAGRGYDRTDRTDRGFDRGERRDAPQRGFSRDDRAGTRSDRGFDRGYDRGGRDGQRGYRGDRPSGGSGYRDDRPRRDFGDRPQRFNRDGAGERALRGERFERGDRFERTERSARPDWTPRGHDDQRRDDRPRRDFSDRPRRDFDDRPRRDSSYYPSREARAFEPQDDVVLEKLEAAMTTAAEVDGVTFADLGLGGNISRALAELGAETPFPIQAATIPDVLSGRDVLGRGRTGSGKTIAFGAPLVELLLRANAEGDGGDAAQSERSERNDRGGRDGRRNRRVFGRNPRALILAPTRELALQIDRTVQPIARSVGLFTTQIYGGVPQARQVGALQRGVDIIIGTPGRIEDLIEQGRLDLSEVQVTVLDEADHMCDLGFLEPVQRILRRTAPDGQKLLFSATLDTGVANLVDEFLTEPAVHEVAGEDQASSTIDHRVLLIEHREKAAIIEQLAAGEGRKLVFTRTRSYAEQLAEMLEDADIPAVSLHGDLNQSRRTRNLEKLTSGRVNVLVATDVAARGIHVDDISLVIQADAPDEYKTYLHRAGRTGRAGRQGTVVTLVSRNRRRRVDSLLERAEIEAEYTQVAPGDELLDQLASIGD